MSRSDGKWCCTPSRRSASLLLHKGPLSYTQLQKTPRADLASVLPMRVPFSLNMETVDSCNFKCVHCPVSLPDYQDRMGGCHMLPLRVIERLFADVARWVACELSA